MPGITSIISGMSYPDCVLKTVRQYRLIKEAISGVSNGRSSAWPIMAHPQYFYCQGGNNEDKNNESIPFDHCRRNGLGTLRAHGLRSGDGGDLLSDRVHLGKRIRSDLNLRFDVHLSLAGCCRRQESHQCHPRETERREDARRIAQIPDCEGGRQSKGHCVRHLEKPLGHKVG